MGEDEDGSDEHSTEDFHSEPFDSDNFDPLAGLDPAVFDPLAGLDPAVFDPLAEIEIDHIEPLAEFGSEKFESPVVSRQTASISGGSTLTSEIQIFLTQAKAQLAYQRTRQALSMVDKHINDKVLLFLAANIISSLPRFLSIGPAAVATAIGTVLALYHYVLDRQD